MTATERERTEEGTPSAEELELLAYFDGELDAVASDAFEARVARDPELAARLRAMEALAGFVSSDADRVYAAAEVDSIADAVMAKIAQADAERPKAAVIGISSALAANPRKWSSNADISRLSPLTGITLPC